MMLSILVSPIFNALLGIMTMDAVFRSFMGLQLFVGIICIFFGPYFKKKEADQESVVS